MADHLEHNFLAVGRCYKPNGFQWTQFNHLWRYKSAIGFKPLVLATAVCLITPSLSQAQQGRGFELEEIIVTAQKREQSQMDVPIAMGAFTPDDITRTGALSILDIHHYIAGLNVDEAQVTQAPISIRGISGSNISIGGDPSVATFYDGAYVPRAASTAAFSDLERIEILKGPQGTLFGRNAAVGVINILPNRPSDEFDGFVSVKVGNFGLRRYEAMVNIPLNDSLFSRFNVLTNRRDGIAENVGPSSGDPGGQDSITARGSLLWQISEATNLQLSYDWDKVDQSPPLAIGVSPFAFSTDPYSSKIANDVVNGAETRDMYSVTAKFNHSFNDVWSMRYVANYRDFEVSNLADQDGTADVTRYLDTNNIEDSDILYTELQFNFENNALDMVMGANFSKEHTYQDVPINLMTDSLIRNVTDGIKSSGALRGSIAGGAGGFEGDGGIGDAVLGMLDSIDHLWDPADWGLFTTLLGIGPLGQSDAEYGAVANAIGEPLIFGPSFAGQIYNETSTSTGDYINWGVYFDASYAVTEAFNLAVGVRYSKDEKDFTWSTPLSSFILNNPQLGITSNLLLSQQDFLEASEQWSKTTGRIVASYTLTEDILTFASLSTGYKSGGFDTLDTATAQFPLEPEEVTNYELGVKGDFYDARLRAQFSVYQFEIDGLQRTVNSRQPGETAAVLRVINGNTESKGAELTLDWVVTSDLLLGLITTYTNTDASFPSFYDALGNIRAEQTDRTIDKPHEAYTLRMDWTPSIPVGELLVHVDYIYTKNNDEQSVNHLPVFNDIDGYGDDRKRLNARLTWTSDKGNWEVAAWGRNLLDEEYIASVETISFSQFGTLFVRVEDPLSYGVDVKYLF